MIFKNPKALKFDKLGHSFYFLFFSFHSKETWYNKRKNGVKKLRIHFPAGFGNISFKMIRVWLGLQVFSEHVLSAYSYVPGDYVCRVNLHYIIRFHWELKNW